MSQNSVFAVDPKPIHNEAGLLVGMKFNGGSDDPDRHYSDFLKVKSAINAIQDWYLGIYIVPEPGLHLKTTVSRKGYQSCAGYVSANYAGYKVKPAKDGWDVLAIDEGTYIRGRFTNSEHFVHSVRKHNVIEMLAAGEGFVIHFGPNSRRFWDAAIQRMKAGRIDGRVMAKTAIRTSIIDRQSWQNVDRTGPTPEQVLICDQRGNQFNMFSLVDGVWCKRVDRYGNEMQPKYWLPNDTNNVRQWQSLADQGVQVVR